ncbi:MAG: GNAT family N-acetyltransferase [Actinomycetota bacterium]|nr:GNAT family N-acetyltransferase [Actinomycetota bacterium]
MRSPDRVTPLARPVTTDEELAAAYAVRREVFTVGQGVPESIERDDRDAAAVHVIAELDGTVIGAGRLVRHGDSGRIGRLAVLEPFRGRGIGAALLQALERAAEEFGLTEVELHAQTHARRFYDRAGYTAFGEGYLEAGIEHISMRRPLPVLRDARDDDSAALIELIGSCWAEYPGCVLDVDAEEPWLRSPATAYGACGGRLWVAELDGRVVGCAGLRGRELKSLYVAAAARRRGLGARLVRVVEREAAARGCRDLVLWSDTRFLEAHRLYAACGWEMQPEIRGLHDLSNTTEHLFTKTLGMSVA